MKITITVLLLFLSNLSIGQKDDSIRVQVLNKNIVGKEFTFGGCDGKGSYETTLTYLGSVKTKKGKTYKIMNSLWTWGMSCRATARILVFNEKNEYLGTYYMFDSCDLPTRLKNGYLIFINSEGSDRKNLRTVNFNHGIPKSFFDCHFES